MKRENGICQCEMGQHFDTTLLTCINSSVLNMDCISNRTCNRHLKLSCIEC